MQKSLPLSAVMVADEHFCLRVAITLLKACLFVWAAFAPLVWNLRDGLGPDSR
jgi:hypothetical protein